MSSSTFHAVVTRFSYRNVPNAAGTGGIPPWVLADDPLDPRRLDFRLAVFEITCAASLLAQTSQDFEWILIVDPHLPENYQARLTNLLRGRARTHLHVYDPDEDLGSADWLTRYDSAKCSRVLTTQLDDDDALPANFIQVLRRRIEEADEEKPAVRVAASRRSDQWELVSSARAPLGYRCAWHRGNWVVSTGLSLLSPAGQGALTVLALNHQIADMWACGVRGDALRSMLTTRWELRAPRAAVITRFIAGQLDQFQKRVRRLPATTRWSQFVDLTAEVGAVLVANHFLNDQFLRLLEPKPDRVRAEGPESFPNVPVRFDRFRECSPMFRKVWPNYLRLLRITATRVRRWPERLRLLLWASWRFMRV